MSDNDALARAALRAEAVQWFNLERSGDMTVDDELRFLEWLDRSDTHRDAYRLVERAWLIAGTIEQDPEMLPSGERRVDLVAGRAFFRVAPDPSRPFIVNAGGKSVRAIGTAFEVSFEHGNMVVTLAEGKVRVEETGSGSGSGTDMSPGGQIVIGADHNWYLSRVDVA